MRNLIPAILLCAFLAGCGDRDRAPIASTAPSENAPAMPDVQPTGPVTLQGSFDLAGTQPREVNPDELEAVSAGMSCSLDSVNGAPAGTASIAAQAPVSLSGWFQHDEGDVSVVAVMKADKAFVFPMSIGNARPDVAQVIGSKNVISDVTGAVGAGLPAGEYAVYYVRKAGDGLAKCVGDKKVRIG